ncbi:hypothetical protein D9611_012769 [Ephemerocybe angulata]|uniref:Uncharacterized protein n=1 Tax=Ephemerocybe angulata TaxID=980116 RepID=A0A8H5CC79_9AGAR|nr:hypothetical protein D9611_012769 [Tulosesus angulatus]
MISILLPLPPLSPLLSPAVVVTLFIDLHAAPGKQNADSHSGTSNHTNFFNDPHNLRRGLYAISSLTHLLSTLFRVPEPLLNNVICIELLNELALQTTRFCESGTSTSSQKCE